MTSREHDLVVYGASGFVGRLTAEYLALHAPRDLRIALGGRSRGKLEQVRDGLEVNWPIVVADSADRPALESLAHSTRVIATTVGPYMTHGLPLVEACVAAGTHYADLTGEVLFMHETIRRLHGPARDSGARIVHACGFDSIPSDLGTLLLHEAAGAPMQHATLVVRAARGGISGGTLASMRGQIDAVRQDRDRRRIVLDPYALSPDRSAEPDLGPQSDVHGPFHDPALGGWMAPFVMASVNTRVVRRTNALCGYSYGRELRYREVMAMGEGPVACAKAFGLTAGLGAFVAGLSLPPARALLDRVLPAPGEGPSERARRQGFFRIEIHGTTVTGETHRVGIEAQGDPGYAATAVMFGESAVCLAQGHGLPDRAGVLTPATAMGLPLVARLRAAGQRYGTP